MQNNFVAMIIVVLYMVILLAISWYSTKYLQKKDSASFLFAKKAMSWPLVAMIVSGCAIGGSATSENVGPMLLLNLRHVAHGLRELEDIRASVPDCSDGVCRTQADVSQIDIDSIVSSILAKLKVL